MIAMNVRMKQALQMRGMKQVELADKTGIDKGQISSYLSGKYKPKQENLSLMAVALNVSEYWLMGMDVAMERTAGAAREEQLQRVQVYARQMYEMKEPGKVLKLYEQLSEENRAKVRTYMERLLAVQRLEDGFEIKGDQL